MYTVILRTSYKFRIYLIGRNIDFERLEVYFYDVL